MFSELLREITDLTPWKESIDAYISNLSINSVIVTVMMIFMLLGAIDKARGNKHGYGAAFDEGFQAMGPLAIAMVGVIAAAPVLSMVLRPIVGPIYQMLGSSPSIFATTLLLADAGGYPLAVELAGENIVMGQFAGIIVGCTMGCILLFDIPVALTLIQKKDRPLLACGILVGVITAPIGCFVGGIVMNVMTDYSMHLGTMLLSLLPVILVAVVLAAGLWFKPIALMNGFAKFGAFVTGLIAIFVAIAVFQYETRHPTSAVPFDGRSRCRRRFAFGKQHRDFGRYRVCFAWCVSYGGIYKAALRRRAGESRRKAGHERNGIGGHCGNTGQQHPDLSDDEGYEPQGKAHERCVCFLCGVYVRRPFGFCRRCQRRYDCSNDFCQAGMWPQCIGFGKFARTTAAFQSAKGGRK